MCLNLHFFRNNMYDSVFFMLKWQTWIHRFMKIDISIWRKCNRNYFVISTKVKRNREKKLNKKKWKKSTQFHEYVARNSVLCFLFLSRWMWWSVEQVHTVLAVYVLYSRFFFSYFVYINMCSVARFLQHISFENLSLSFCFSFKWILFPLAKPLAYTFGFMLQSIASFLFKWSKYHLAIIGHKIYIKEL